MLGRDNNHNKKVERERVKNGLFFVIFVVETSIIKLSIMAIITLRESQNQ